MYIKAEAFDILGLGVFSFIAVISIRSLFFSQPFSKLVVYSLLIISILGLIVDGYIVYRTYLKRKK